MDTSLLVMELRGAVQRGEIEAWFQPQVDVESGRIVAAEALARWHHPQFGQVPPTVFIPIAERVGVINDLGQFMLEASCAAALRWQALPNPIGVSVNVSPAQLATTAFTERLAAVLMETALPARALTIEITESLPLPDLSAVVERLEDLRELGLGISIDDYGAGHSSLMQLDDLQATELKLDQSLVQDRSPATDALLTTVVDYSHRAGVRIVAEGIETAEQLQRARDLGCDRVQGYLLGPPMPEAEFEAVLARN